MKLKLIKINTVFIVVFFLLTVYFFSLHFFDQSRLSDFFHETMNKFDDDFSGLEINYDHIIQIRNSVVSELADIPDKADERHLWGYRVSDIINNKTAGECGEVTRLLLNVLKRMDIPARRVTFYLNNDFVHALLEVKINGRWLMVDTSNGPAGLKEFITNNPASINDHFQSKGISKNNSFNVSEELQEFGITHFTYFFNLNSILYKLLGFHLYIVKPLPTWIYYIIENPPLLAAWFSLVILLAITLLTILRNKKNKKKESMEEQTSQDAWIEYLKQIPGNSFYLLPEMSRFYDSNRNSRSCHVVVEENGMILGMALGEISKQSWDLIGMSKRTVFYTEPSYNGDLVVLDKLLKGIKSKAQGIFIQIRNTRNATPQERMVYKKNSFILQDHLDAKIPLDAKQKIWNGFEKDKKKGIRKASEKYQLEVVEKSDPEGVNIFYSLMKPLYQKKRHPFKSKSYFENMLNILGKEKLRLFFAYYEDIPIATQLAIFHNKTVTALYTATSSDHLDKKAGDLLIWHLVNSGVDNGYNLFDFGGGGNPNKPYGPREYKKRFGCHFVNVGRFVYPRNKIYYAINSIYQFFLKG